MKCKISSKIICLVALFASVSLSFLLSFPVFAQSENNIVNEPPAANDLRDAILRIGRRPTDSNALYDAGNAALMLGDAIVARDFFLRAERIAPSSGRIKAGLARTQLSFENPVEALRLFDLSISLGWSARDIAFDRGLAFDLIGSFRRAQQEYILASQYITSNELVIRQAISYSLSGNEKKADALLLPLLRINDSSAWRARSFLLAARGETKESYKIAQGFLNSNEAKNLRPYLKTMNKLTKSQQAAAVHFGHFPASGLVGKDNEAIRIAAANTIIKPTPSDRLIPIGKPLGEVKVAAKDNKPEKRKIKNVKVAAAQIQPPKAALIPSANVTVANKALVEVKPPAIIPNKAPETKANKEAVFSQAAVTSSLNKELDLDNFIASIEIPEEDKERSIAVDLESIKAEQAVKRDAQKRAAAKKLAEKREADKKAAAAAKKREDAKKAQAEKTKARYWVQIATGRDAKGLKFDFRRISRKQNVLFKGKMGATSKWGATNRLVVGPFSDLKAAKQFESKFRKGGGDGFVWRSANGTIVTPLK